MSINVSYKSSLTTLIPVPSFFLSDHATHRGSVVAHIILIVRFGVVGLGAVLPFTRVLLSTPSYTAYSQFGIRRSVLITCVFMCSYGSDEHRLLRSVTQAAFLQALLYTRVRRS